MERAADALFDGHGVHLCGHRGHSVDGLENSKTSFRLARQNGATLVETDIRLTADEEFVVFHDAVLDDASTGKGPVRGKTLKQLRSVHHCARAGNRSVHGEAQQDALITFAETLEFAAELNLGLIVEVKDRLTDDQHIKDIIQTIDDLGMRDQVLLSSFDHAFLKHVKDKHPHTSTFGIIHTRHTNPVSIASDAKLDVYSVDYPRFHIDDAAALRAAGVQVAQFLPRPGLFARGGDDHHHGLADAVASMRDGDMHILGVDDVVWGDNFLKKHEIAKHSATNVDVMA